MCVCVSSLLHSNPTELAHENHSQLAEAAELDKVTAAPQVRSCACSSSTQILHCASSDVVGLQLERHCLAAICKTHCRAELLRCCEPRSTGSSDNHDAVRTAAHYAGSSSSMASSQGRLGSCTLMPC